MRAAMLKFWKKKPAETTSEQPAETAADAPAPDALADSHPTAIEAPEAEHAQAEAPLEETSIDRKSVV